MKMRPEPEPRKRRNGSYPDAQEPGPAFGNFSGDIPLQIDEIAEMLMTIADGWPKVISGALCVPKGSKVRPLRNESELFAWIRRKVPVDWKRGGGRAVPMDQFYVRLCDQEEEFSWASEHPHFPPVPGVYYLTMPPAARHTGKLDELLERFCPATCDDAELLRALVLTEYWGGPPGQRPQFVFAADSATDARGGRGVGKTKAAELLAYLVGGCIDIQLSSNSDRVTSNLLSPTSWSRRVVLVDNLKTLHFSQGTIESFITRSEITGHRLYHGFATRPNLLVWIVTVNDASFSTDMARRSVVIHLQRPAQTSDAWYTETVRFIDENREAIVADVRWHLEVKRAARMRNPREDTWADWRTGVLSRCNRPNELVRQLENRRQGIDGDQADLANMVTHICACLKTELPSVDLDISRVWIPSLTLVEWVRMLKNYEDRQATAFLKRLPAEYFRFRHRREGNGYWWQGPNFDPENPPVPRYLHYQPNAKRRM